MDQFKKLFAAMSLAQKIVVAAMVLLVAAGVPLFTRWQHESNFKPLFTGMAPEDAGAIVTKLKESGAEYRLAENGTSVLVPAGKVDEARLELAGAGLPKTGRIGFELFDKTNISLTDFGEHVNYRRAVEGELEKTIKSIDGIEQARVHVTFPKDSVFLDSREPAKASVLVHLRTGLHLLPQNVTAVANLVASAVESLSPDAVAIVDMNGNLLSKRRRPSGDGSEAAENALEYKNQVEKDLTAKVESTLDPLLGEGKFRVGVTADCDFSISEQTDEVYDPTRSVMSNSKKTDDLSQSGVAGGVPGTASNLPRSEIKAQASGSAGPGGAPEVSRHTEDVSFQTSRTVRNVKVPRGVVKKISAALLIDQDVEWQGKGKNRKRVLIPPSAEKLKTIHDVVAGVLGISTDRGDQLVVETLPFEQTRNAEDSSVELAKPAIPGKLTAKDLLADKKILIGAVAGVIFVAVLVGFMLRRPKAGTFAAQLQEKSKSMTLTGHADPLSPGASELADRASNSGEAAAAKELDEIAPHLQLPAMSSHAKVLLEHLRKTVTKDPDAAADVIRSWMEEV